VADSALTEAESALLRELTDRGVRFLIVGASATVIQGANTATQDIDLWFEDTTDPRIILGSFGAMPPTIGGEPLGDRFDVVVHVHGLEPFDVEFAHAPSMEISGVAVRILPLERIIASKRATNRPRDRAQLPALEEALAAATTNADDS
jgi:predicted nucleotidyltransferase